MQPGHQIVEAPEKGGEGSETVTIIAGIFEGLDHQKEHAEQRSGAQVTFRARRILDAGRALREAAVRLLVNRMKVLIAPRCQSTCAPSDPHPPW